MARFLCSAILFDLDGVLVDSTPAVTRVWTAWAVGNGIEPNKVLAVVHGRRTVEVLQLMAPHLDREIEARKIEQGIVADKAGTVAIPGALQLVSSLPQDRWCVVTSGIGVLARARLQAAGLPVPQVLVSADDVVNGKPDPEPFLKAASLLGIRPEEGLVIEDAPLGIQAGHAAGMKVIGLASTYRTSELHTADAVVETLEGVRVRIVEGKVEVEI